MTKNKPKKPNKNQLLNYLKGVGVKFKILAHKVVYTAHDEAETQKKKLAEVAKTVLVKVDKGLALVIVPASKYVDLKAIKKALSAKGGSASGGKAAKVEMAKEADITKRLKSKIGLLHPFGNLYKISTLLDKALTKSKKIITSAGSYTESIEIAVKDFEKLVQPIKGVFSKSKRR
ncbi:MAG: YbaK/EbsC family protein [Candidatus Doudnabacteria bacterium]|nr:YbaK/EbsC family protein [Candidatus Doudnabacteria bacterium]